MKFVGIDIMPTAIFLTVSMPIVSMGLREKHSIFMDIREYLL